MWGIPTNPIAMFSNTLVWVEQLMGWGTGQQHVYDPRNWVITSRYIKYIYIHTYLRVINQLELGGGGGTLLRFRTWGTSKRSFLGGIHPLDPLVSHRTVAHGAFFHVARIDQKMDFLSRHVGTRGLNQPVVDWTFFGTGQKHGPKHGCHDQTKGKQVLRFDPYRNVGDKNSNSCRGYHRTCATDFDRFWQISTRNKF